MNSIHSACLRKVEYEGSTRSPAANNETGPLLQDDPERSQEVLKDAVPAQAQGVSIPHYPLPEVHAA